MRRSVRYIYIYIYIVKYLYIYRKRHPWVNKVRIHLTTSTPQYVSTCIKEYRVYTAQINTIDCIRDVV